jgi:hypothetical protein
MFDPEVATVFISSAVCHVEGLEQREMKFTGVGKFTYLSASETELDFEEVQTGAHRFASSPCGQWGGLVILRGVAMVAWVAWGMA